MLALQSPVASLPSLISVALRPLPLLPLQLLLSAVMGRILLQHSDMFERLGIYAGKRYGLAPSDLPFAFVLDTSPAKPTITATRSLPPGIDARISGPLLALLGMVDGTFDGDALFFSRTIVVEGDVEAVLALRNAIDDADVDVVRDGVAVFGPLGEALLRLYRQKNVVGGSPRVGAERREFSPWN